MLCVLFYHAMCIILNDGSGPTDANLISLFSLLFLQVLGFMKKEPFKFHGRLTPGLIRVHRKQGRKGLGKGWHG